MPVTACESDRLGVCDKLEADDNEALGVPDELWEEDVVAELDAVDELNFVAEAVPEGDLLFEIELVDVDIEEPELDADPDSVVLVEGDIDSEGV